MHISSSYCSAATIAGIAAPQTNDFSMTPAASSVKSGRTGLAFNQHIVIQTTVHVTTETVDNMAETAYQEDAESPTSELFSNIFNNNNNVWKNLNSFLQKQLDDTATIPITFTISTSTVSSEVGNRRSISASSTSPRISEDYSHRESIQPQDPYYAQIQEHSHRNPPNTINGVHFSPVYEAVAASESTIIPNSDCGERYDEVSENFGAPQGTDVFPGSYSARSHDRSRDVLRRPFDTSNC